MGSGREDGDIDLLYGVHPVAEAMETRPRTIERILVVREFGKGRIGRILKQARSAGIPVSYLSREVLARKVGRKAVHQGIVAQVSAFEYCDTAGLIDASIDDGNGLLVALDRVEDPRNLGAIARSAAAAGADGIILSTDGTAGITPAARKSSAGAVERIGIARDPNLGRTLTRFLENGYQVVGLDPRADSLWDEHDWTGGTVLVAGGEERGPRPGILKKCSKNVAVPLSAGVESLNVSVAVGIVLFEAVRQRRRLKR